MMSVRTSTGKAREIFPSTLSASMLHHLGSQEAPIQSPLTTARIILLSSFLLSSFPPLLSSSLMNECVMKKGTPTLSLLLDILSVPSLTAHSPLSLSLTPMILFIILPHLHHKAARLEQNKGNQAHAPTCSLLRHGYRFLHPSFRLHPSSHLNPPFEWIKLPKIPNKP